MKSSSSPSLLIFFIVFRSQQKITGLLLFFLLNVFLSLFIFFVFSHRRVCDSDDAGASVPQYRSGGWWREYSVLRLLGKRYTFIRRCRSRCGLPWASVVNNATFAKAGLVWASLGELKGRKGELKGTGRFKGGRIKRAN